MKPTVSEAPLFRYSRWALAVTVACMPLYVIRFRIGPLPTTLLEILIVVTIGLWAVGRLMTREWRLPRTSIEIPIVLLLAAGLIGIAVSPDHVGALGQYRAYFIEPALLFYVAVDLLRKPADFRIVLAGFGAGATVFAIMNLGAWVVALATHVDIQTADAPRALYLSPNSVALFLEPAVTLAAGFALYADDRRDRIAALVCLPFLLASLVFTLSRGGLLTLTVLGIFAVLTMSRRRLKLALLGALAVGALAILQIPFVGTRVVDVFNPNTDTTVGSRVQIWSDTLHMLRDHPIFGSGLRAYSTVMQNYVTTRNHIPELYPHNIFLAMWSELGLLGLAAFVVVLGTLLWRGWSSFSEAEGFARALFWGTSAAFVAIGVHGLVDTPYFNNDLAVEFWIVAALEIAAIGAFGTTATGKESFER
jgi:putative inorganic carbon (HCO3(-)) transporter